jgi:hypothetical protein
MYLLGVVIQDVANPEVENSAELAVEEVVEAMSNEREPFTTAASWEAKKELGV